MGDQFIFDIPNLRLAKAIFRAGRFSSSVFFYTASVKFMSCHCLKSILGAQMFTDNLQGSFFSLSHFNLLWTHSHVSLSCWHSLGWNSPNRLRTLQRFESYFNSYHSTNPRICGKYVSIKDVGVCLDIRLNKVVGEPFARKILTEKSFL